MTTETQVVYLRGGNPTREEFFQNLNRLAIVRVAETIDEMLELVEKHDAAVVFCEWTLRCGTWREALTELRSRYPHVPAIVISRTEGVDDGIQEWLEVLSGGAFDLLLAPANEYSVHSTLEHAVTSGEARLLRTAV